MAGSVVIAMLSHSNPQLPVMTFLRQESDRILKETRRKVELFHRTSSSLIWGRNALVSDFLAHEEATDLIFIDDDNHPDPGGLIQLLEAKADFVAIPCRKKTDDKEDWPVRWLNDRPLERDPVSGLVEVMCCGTGILRLTRKCLERMIESGRFLEYSDPTTVSGKAHEFFKFMVRDNHPHGEDTHLCLEWREMGGKVWIIPDIVTHHYGIKDYSGSPAKTLSRAVADFEVRDLIKGTYKVKNEFSALTLPDKKVALIIASRGNPKKLAETVRRNLASMILTDTKIVIGLDRDDETLEEAKKLLYEINDNRVIGCEGNREDSLGGVYNRCVKAVNADLYINGTDDIVIETECWDAILLREAARIPDGIGVIGFGKMPIQSQLPLLMAATRGMIDKMGYFIQPYTPFWWADTWLYEMAWMINRLHKAKINCHSFDFNQTRGLRDVIWWATFYDETRPMRAALARTIINDPDYEGSPDYRQDVIGSIPEVGREFEKLNAILRHPEHARVVELQYGHEAPADERYIRIKRNAEQIISELQVA